MLYSKTLEVPANTTILLPERTELHICIGVVRHVWIRWRWGGGNLCGVRMKHHEHQFWPRTGSEWFPSNVYPLDFAEMVNVDQEPLDIAIEAYNLDDTYPHTVWVAFNILRPILTPAVAGFLADIAGV